MRSLRIQLLLSHLVFVVLLAIVMAGAIGGFFTLTHSIDSVLRSNFAAILAGEHLRESVDQEQESLTIYLAGHPEIARPILQEATAEFDLNIVAMTRQASGNEAQRMIPQIVSDHAAFIQSLKEVVQAQSLEGSMKARSRYVTTTSPVRKRLLAWITRLIRISQTAIASANYEAEARAQSTFLTSFFITVGSLALAIIMALRLVRIALNPLSVLAKSAEQIGSGDLSGRITIQRDDEIGALGKSFNLMAEKLDELRNREQDRLERAERMSDAALESLYDPVIVTEASGRIVFLNSAAEGLFGPVPQDERVDIQAHVEDARIVRAVRQAITQEAISAGEDEGAMVPIRVAGAARTYRLRATPMRSAEGEILGAVAVLEDITHLREIDRLKTDFIGVASHELRTPVTSLLLSVQLLEEGAAGDLSDSQKRVVAMQKQDLERLDRLMKDLLDVSRLQSGSIVPRFTSVMARDLVASAIESTNSMAASQKVSLIPEGNAFSSDLAVRADKGQIQRVLINLISNGIRHTPAGGRVTVRANRRANDVLFSVEDTGEGVPPEYLKSIFDRFVQVPGATQGGAGLGLSIAQTIVQAHGGQLSVKSELGSGSSFSFNIRGETTSAGDQ